MARRGRRHSAEEVLEMSDPERKLNETRQKELSSCGEKDPDHLACRLV